MKKDFIYIYLLLYYLIYHKDVEHEFFFVVVVVDVETQDKNTSFLYYLMSFSTKIIIKMRNRELELQ